MAKKIVKRAKPAKEPTTQTPASVDLSTLDTPSVKPTTELPPVEKPVVSEVQLKHGHQLFLGAWAYVLGLVVAVAAAVIKPSGLDYYTMLVLALFGIIVGLMNITDEEVLLFLVASLAFIVSTSSVKAVLPDEFVMMHTLLRGIIIFTGSGAFVVAFKALFKVAKNE